MFTPEMLGTLNYVSSQCKNLVLNYLNKEIIKINSHYALLKVHHNFNDSFKFINDNLTAMEIMPQYNNECNHNCPHYKARDLVKCLWHSTEEELVNNSCTHHKEQILKDLYMHKSFNHHPRNRKHKYHNIKKVTVYPNIVDDLIFLHEIPSIILVIKCKTHPYYIQKRDYILWLKELHSSRRTTFRITLYFDDKIVWRSYF